MKRLIALAASVLLLLPCAPASAEWGIFRSDGPSAKQSCQNGCERPHPAVARIFVTGRNAGERSIGTAVLVWKGSRQAVAVTAQHLFRAAAKPVKVLLKFPNGEEFSATLGPEDPAGDLAAVTIEGVPSADPVELYLDDPRTGEAVTVAGYGPDGCYQTTAGKIVGFRRAQDGAASWLTMTGASRLGDSGGPMLNTQGRLVGILWGTDGETSIGSYNGRICQFLETQRYALPWNADVAAERERTRQKEAAPPLVPVQPYASGSTIDQQARAMAQDALDRVAAVEQSMGSVGSAASSAREQAAAAVAKANDLSSGIAAKVEDVAKPFLFGILQKVGLFGGLGIGIGVFLLVKFIKKDIADYKTTGDPLAIQKLAKFIPGQWDDQALAFLAKMMLGQPGGQAPQPQPQAPPSGPTVAELQAQIAALKAAQAAGKV